MAKIYLFHWSIEGKIYSERFCPYSLEAIVKYHNYYQGEYRASGKSDNNGEATNTADDYNDFLISDYVFDAHSAYILQRIYEEDEAVGATDFFLHMKAEKALLYDTLISSMVNASKWDISVLERVDFKTEKSELESRVLNLFNSVEAFVNNSTKDTIINVERSCQTLISLRINRELTEICERIRDIVSLMDVDTKEHVNDLYVKAVHQYLKKIPHAMGPGYNRRYIEIRKILRHYKNQEIRGDFKYEYLLGISTGHYKEEAPKIAESIRNEVNMLSESNISLNDSLVEYEEKMEQLQNFFGNTSNKIRSLFCGQDWKSIRDKYRIKGRGCFAILHTDKMNYFAMSSRDDYEGEKWKSLLSTTNVMKTLIEAINENLFNNTYEYAYLSDNTLRYTEIVPESQKIVNINTPVKLGEDRANLSINEIGRTYGCCERKMFAANNCAGHKTLFSKWVPCGKCIQAILREGSIDTYAFFADKLDAKIIEELLTSTGTSTMILKKCVIGFTFEDN